jgi:glycosyltransferase involved in cell wall biosynthesis
MICATQSRLNSLNPFISVVTVSLNAAPTIADTIASVSLQQVDFEVEHICVDGGSTDGSREIIDRWAASVSHLRTIFEPDGGIFDAMNKGLRAARGEYVVFLNADDFLVDKTTLAMVTRGLTPGSSNNPDLVVCDVSMGNLGQMGVWRHRRVPTLLGKLRGCGLFPVHQGQFTKRRLLDAIGGFNSDIRLSADVIQFYDLERMFKPTIQVVRSDVTFMRFGGASNAGLRVMYFATVEFYKHLASTYSYARAAGMVIVKTLQSMMELRYGHCPHDRWFASEIDASLASTTT